MSWKGTQVSWLYWLLWAEIWSLIFLHILTLSRNPFYCSYFRGRLLLRGPSLKRTKENIILFELTRIINNLLMYIFMSMQSCYTVKHLLKTLRLPRASILSGVCLYDFLVTWFWHGRYSLHDCCIFWSYVLLHDPKIENSLFNICMIATVNMVLSRNPFFFPLLNLIPKLKDCFTKFLTFNLAFEHFWINFCGCQRVFFILNI